MTGQWVSLTIREDDPRWDHLAPLVELYQIVFDMAETEFTSAERRQAPFLDMAAWNNEYPQPEDNFDYFGTTYNRPDFCEHCEVGKVQKAPFRMRREPKWGRRHVMQLNWVFDEFFIRPEVWHDVFRPFGVGCRPVLKHHTGQELTSVVQLDVALVADAPLCLEGYPTETCTACGQVKYQPICRGFFPAFDGEPGADLFKSREWFGSGGSGNRAVMVSHRLFQAIEAHQVKGFQFKPQAAD